VDVEEKKPSDRTLKRLLIGRHGGILSLPEIFSSENDTNASLRRFARSINRLRRDNDYRL
jgi:hypothetical protein